MDVGSLLGALTGNTGVQIEIQLHPPAQQAASSGISKDDENSSIRKVVPMDHYPSWRLHKNPFWRVQHPANSNKLPLQPHQQQQQQPGLPQQQPGFPQQQPGFPQQPGLATGASSSMAYPPMPSPNATGAAAAVGGIDSGVYAYRDDQDVQGSVILRVAPGKKVEHLGVRVQFIGRIDMSAGIHEGKAHYDFVSLSKELTPPGVFFQPETVFPFTFKNMDKEFESYRGRNVSVRYIVRALMERKFLPPLTREHDVWVQLLGLEPKSHEAIKMEVGIEDCLHIEFEYSRRHYHLQDTITGKIHFLLVRIKIKHMELAVIRRETSGEGVAAAAAAAGGSGGTGAVPGGAAAAAAGDSSNVYTETQTLVKYEIMDGAPVKGEVIPVKLSLQGIPADLTPSYTAINNRFSVRYFLNLVLVDEDDRRYFKQQEIILWRKVLG